MNPVESPARFLGRCTLLGIACAFGVLASMAASAQGTGVNRESKYLMLSLAFETWQVHRITLKADVRNVRSRAAIEALGAQLDGVRRAEARGSDDTVRDTAYYSILSSEWPLVRERIHARLGLAEAA